MHCHKSTSVVTYFWFCINQFYTVYCDRLFTISLLAQVPWLVVTEVRSTSFGLVSTVTKTHTTLRLFLTVMCGIARFLCAMHVFKVRASSSSRRLPLYQTLFLSQPVEKNCILTQSPTTHPAYLMPWEPKLVLQKFFLLPSRSQESCGTAPNFGKK